MLTAEQTRVVRLLKNEIYPACRLYAQMAKKAPARAGGQRIEVTCIR